MPWHPRWVHENIKTIHFSRPAYSRVSPIEGGADVRLTNPHWRAQSDVAALSKFAALLDVVIPFGGIHDGFREMLEAMPASRAGGDGVGHGNLSFLQSHPDAHQTGAHGHVRAAFGIDESADSAGGANLDSPGMELMRRVVAAYWRDYVLFEDVLPECPCRTTLGLWPAGSSIRPA